MGWTNENRTYMGIPVGIRVRGQIAKSVIFRVQPGNGYYGSQIGKHYQHKYTYFVPSSINNIEGQPARDALAQAVSNWQTVLSESEKTDYQRRAIHSLRMSGYNLYIREYILGAL